MKSVFYLIIILLSVIGILVLILDIIPYLYPKVLRKLKPIKTLETIPKDFEEKILDAAFSMANSDQVTMVWEDRIQPFTQNLFNLFKKTQSHQDFRKYNYPRAFLLLGMLAYIKKTNNEDQLQKFRILFDDYLSEDGTPKFVVNKVDQGPFGLVALLLFETFKENKYLYFSQCIYEYMYELVDSKSGILNYRKDSIVVFNDMLGLAVPFLIEYGRVLKDEEIIKIAQRQIEIYIKHGIDNATHIPAHGFVKDTKLKVGSSNWGRGIGWYFLSIAYFNKYNKEFEKELKSLDQSLMLMRNKDNLWNQFIGSSGQFDASTTVLFLYSQILSDSVVLKSNELIGMLKSYLTTDGYILQTSGDTYAINHYSKSFGKSELSQGLLLSTLALLKNKI